MKKLFKVVFIILLLLVSCKAKKIHENNIKINDIYFDLTKEINKEIMEGFFDNDTIVSTDVYLMK